MRLTERLTRVDAETLLYEATIDDPETWTAPWTFEVPMKLLDGEKWEYACHEGTRLDAHHAGRRTRPRSGSRRRAVVRRRRRPEAYN